MLKYTLLTFICVWLSGCDHLAFQDMAIKNARIPSKPPNLELKEDLNLEFKRGKIITRFTSILKQGEYKAIIETDSGMFYLAPKGSFTYKTNDRVKSTIGGIFTQKGSRNSHVWIAPEELNQSQWEVWVAGENIDNMLPSIFFIGDRPWVEKDFIVPPDTFSLGK